MLMHLPSEADVKAAHAAVIAARKGIARHIFAPHSSDVFRDAWRDHVLANIAFKHTFAAREAYLRGFRTHHIPRLG